MTPFFQALALAADAIGYKYATVVQDSFPLVR